MQPYIVGLPEAPQGILFTLKDIGYFPVSPRMNEPFTVKGKIELFKIPFIGPIWVIATVVYPESFWEELIPIWGSPEVRESDTALGGNFEITFKKGFEREGEFSLAVRAYAGPTMPLDSLTLPPFPPVTSEETTFVVSGEAPPQEENFQNFQVKSYGKGTATPVSPPSTLELKSGDTCRVYLSMNHKGDALTGQFYASIGNVIAVVGFDEILVGQINFSIPASTDWKAFESYVDIPITSAISAGKYDLYAKIIGITGGDVISPTLNDVIVIAGVPAAGQITSKWINKSPEGNKIPLPTTVAADGNTFEIGIQAKNTSAVTFTGGIEIKVYDPGGILRFSPAVNYAGMSPGEELLWGTYNVCSVDKAGTWTIKIRFLEKTTSTVLAETTTTMTATTVSAQYKGSITSKYINKSPEGSNIPLPATVTADGNTFEVGIRAKNTGSVSYIGGIKLEVYDPDGTLRRAPTIDWAGISPNEELGWVYNICSVDKAGTWTIKITFLEQSTSAVLAETSTTMTATTAAPPPTEPQFSNLRITYYDSQVARGGTCLIQVAFDYLGPQVYGKVLHVAIGNDGWAGFDEILAAELTFDIWHYETKTTLYAVKGIPITSAISPGVYDLYAKIDSGVPTIESEHLLNVVTITG